MGPSAHLPAPVFRANTSRANPYAPVPVDDKKHHPGDDVPEVIDIVYRTPWATRVFARIARGATCLLMVAVACGVVGGVFAFSMHASPPAWLVIALLIAPWPLAIGLYCAMSRRGPTRLVLRDDVIHAGDWLFGRDVRYEDIRLLRVERPEKTIGRQSTLTLQTAGATPMKIWLKTSDAIECFDALRGLCTHAPAIGPTGETYAPLDAAHADAGRRTLAAEHRRKAAWAMASAVFVGAIALAHIAALLFGWNAVNGRSPPVTRTIIFSAVALGALMSSLEQRRRARAIEADRA